MRAMSGAIIAAESRSGAHPDAVRLPVYHQLLAPLLQRALLVHN